jgi:glutamine amidotransferase
MQILFNNLLEGNGCKGLNFFESNVIPIYENKKSSIGWRNVVAKNEYNFNFLNKNYYFCHSYKVDIIPEEEKYVVARDDETNVISMIKKGNIYGVQFHPEKSQKNGKEFLNYFLYNTTNE